MHEITLRYTLNGRAVDATVEARRLLVHHIREDQRLTGTHIGCDTSQCGACTILVDGVATKSCTVLAAQVDGRDVLTIEGLAGADGDLHPMQQAFLDRHGLQCGYCTPGMVLTALDLAARHRGGLTETSVRHGLHGNLCRCTGYDFIVDSVLDGSARLAAETNDDR